MSDASKLFEQLTSRHRRRILFLLCDKEALQIPRDLRSRGATRPAQADSGGAISKPPPEESLKLRLRHVDLPKLDDADLIEWDPETQTVLRGSKYEEVEPSLRLIADNPHKFPLDLV